MNDALRHYSQHTTINYVSISYLFAIVFFLILSNFFFTTHNHLFYYQSIFILFFIIFNIGLEFYDKRLRHEEVFNRVKAVLKTIKLNIDQVNWSPENYPHL